MLQEKWRITLGKYLVAKTSHNFLLRLQGAVTDRCQAADRGKHKMKDGKKNSYIDPMYY